MARRKHLTDAQVADLKPKATRYALPDPELTGHYVRVQPSGAKSFVCVARDPGGKQVWATIGGTDLFKIEDAREKAREAIKRIKAGLTPFEPPAPAVETFAAVAADWMRLAVKARGLRSDYKYAALLRLHVLPAWKDREFAGIRRSDVARLLDDVPGQRQKGYVLAMLRTMMTWYSLERSDDYLSPIVKGMGKNLKTPSRKRILDDDELRLVWKVAEGNGTFGAFVRLALLTAQRREKILTMRWQDLAADGTWTIQTEAREKGNAEALMLPKAAREIIAKQDVVVGNPYILAGRDKGPFRGVSTAKAAFDAKVTRQNGGEPLPQWQAHDLRRTARSLLSRAGVRPDIAERVLGHAIQGVEGIYDRHGYMQEKAEALGKLADLLALIVNPPATDNVVPLQKMAN